MRRVAMVAIGASAGGVSAVGSLVAALPAAFDPAVLVVLHLPERASAESFAAAIGARAALPLYVPESGEPVRAGAIGLAPPGYHLHVERDRTFSLSLDAPVCWARPSIDVLFESVARAYGEQALAVVLTGANHDGAEGAAAVREAGGLCWVQSPGDAEMDAMPRAALARAGADAVLPLRALALAIGRRDWALEAGRMEGRER
jgi:two-component system chemotaxis response regulator CheB